MAPFAHSKPFEPNSKIPEWHCMPFGASFYRIEKLLNGQGAVGTVLMSATANTGTAIKNYHS